MRSTAQQPPGKLRVRADRGFTLLEVLIAFVIAMFAVTMMIDVAAGALRASRAAARYDDATVRAQSHLDEAANAGPLIPGEREGDDGGGYHWRVRITQSMTSGGQGADQPTMQLTLYTVSVWMTWHDGAGTRDVRLDTERISQPAPAP